MQVSPTPPLQSIAVFAFLFFRNPRQKGSENNWPNSLPPFSRSNFYRILALGSAGQNLMEELEHMLPAFSPDRQNIDHFIRVSEHMLPAFCSENINGRGS